MKNSMLIFLIAIVFLVGFLSGYLIHGITVKEPTINTNNPYGPVELFFGSWSANEESENQSNQMKASYLWSFYQNQSAHLVTEFENETMYDTLEAWRIYRVTNESLVLYSSIGEPQFYGYSFSDQNQKLTLDSEKGSLTFSKE
jgi:hypothetical protein